MTSRNRYKDFAYGTGYLVLSVGCAIGGGLLGAIGVSLLTNEEGGSGDRYARTQAAGPALGGAFIAFAGTASFLTKSKDHFRQSFFYNSSTNTSLQEVDLEASSASTALLTPAP